MAYSMYRDVIISQHGNCLIRQASPGQVMHPIGSRATEAEISAHRRRTAQKLNTQMRLWSRRHPNKARISGFARAGTPPACETLSIPV